MPESRRGDSVRIISRAFDAGNRSADDYVAAILVLPRTSGVPYKFLELFYYEGRDELTSTRYLLIERCQKHSPNL
jgi:hypothetical protein